MAIVTITGPTASGKTTLEHELQKRGYARAISHTTRKRRSTEVHGENYYFVTDEDFDAIQQSGGFIESVEFGGFRYALSAGALRQAQNTAEHVAVVVDPHGAWQIHQFCREVDLVHLGVWIECTPEVQAKRWLARFVGDMVMGKEVIDTYAERLSFMLTTESEWYKNAANYDLRLYSTDLATDQLADWLMAKVENPLSV